MRTTIFVSALMMLAACGDDATGVDAGDPMRVDSGGGTDSGPAPDTAGGLSCAERVPGMPFGTALGRSLEPFMLEACDGSMYEFYNEDYCQSSLTVISIAAGWCMPCIMESMQLEEQINDRYAAQNVRVVQIIVQKEDGSQPDLAYCTNWVNRFGLSNVELIDPLQLTNIYFPDGVLPSTIIVDDQGTIRFRENGATDGLTSLRARIDEVLRDMGRI